MTSVKTKNWLITLGVVIIFSTFLLVWILVGENNALGKEWMIAHNGLLWNGKVNADNYASLNGKYPWFIIQPSGYDASYHIYNPNGIIIKLSIIWLLIGIFSFYVTTSFILKLLKFVNWDFICFMLTTSLTCFTFFFIDLIPHWENGELIYTICILLLTIVVWTIFFFGFNSFFNQLIARSKTAFEYSKDIESEDKEIAASDKEISNMIESTKEQDYIEI